VHLDILTSQCYSLRVDGVRVASGNQFELAAQLHLALVRGTRIAVKSPAGGHEPAPALYVNDSPIHGLHTPLGHLCDAVGKAVWVEFDSSANNPTLTQESVEALAYSYDSTVHSLCSVEPGRVAVFRWIHHKKGKHIVQDILHRITQCFKAQAVGVVLVCPEIAELTEHQASDQHLCNAGSIDAAARIVFGHKFGEENHDNNLREWDKPVEIPVYLVSRFVGGCIGAGDEVLMKKWAHPRLVAQGNVIKYQDKYVDTYRPMAADKDNLVVGSKVRTSYIFQVQIDTLDPLALAANCTIEFGELPTGVFLKPGGIWANRVPAYVDMDQVQTLASRYLKASIVRYNKFGQDLAIFAGTSDNLHGTWGLGFKV
jgi:hypothetical protein